jgi:hypothetical protein
MAPLAGLLMQESPSPFPALTRSWNQTVKGWPNITGLDWSPYGKGFYCGSASPQGPTLLYVDLKGNARVLWQYKGGSGFIWGIPSPDGHYLAILGQPVNRNVWMLEGF